MRSARVFQAALICLFCLGGCAVTSHHPPLLHAEERGLPRTVALDDTPFFPQTRYQCGPAALATVLQAQGLDASPGALSPQVYLPGRKGSLQVEMIAAARQHGGLPYVLDPSFAALLAEVAAGNPVLVLQNLGLSLLPVWHYAVVTGYDLDQEMLTLRSGKLKRRQTSFAVFRRTWRRAGNWALVVMPAGGIPATATVTAYLKAALALEEAGLTTQATEAYRAATGRWPGQAGAWLMRGNLAYAAQRIDEAVEALLQATRLAPTDIRTWNNLAYALRAQGCAEQAKAALQCALSIVPGDSNLRDSLQDINQPVSGLQPEHCIQISCGLSRGAGSVRANTGTALPAAQQ